MAEFGTYPLGTAPEFLSRLHLITMRPTGFQAGLYNGEHLELRPKQHFAYSSSTGRSLNSQIKSHRKVNLIVPLLSGLYLGADVNSAPTTSLTSGPGACGLFVGGADINRELPPPLPVLTSSPTAQTNRAGWNTDGRWQHRRGRQ